MRKILLLSFFLIFNTSVAFASDDFINPEWWKTATISDVQRQIDHGANVNGKHPSGGSVLGLAIINSHNPKIIQMLINAGADVNANVRGTPLMGAVIKDSNIEIVKILIQNGADVNAKDDTTNLGGWTVLMYAAAFTNNPNVIKVLLNSGADVHARNNDGETALMLAKELNPNVEVTKILESAQ